MNIQLYLATFLLLHQFLPGGSFKNGIIGGTDSVPHSHPYMVFIMKIIDRNTFEYCDGFLLNKDYVLTAAHCNGLLMAYLGVHNTTSLTFKDGTFTHATPHPHYNNTTYENDIMLLKLKHPATFSEKVSPIDLPQTGNKNFTKDCLVMGWGCQTFSDEFRSRVLKEANITVSKTNNCPEPELICSEGLVSPGNGDSGGPLVCGGVARGVVSSRFKTELTYVTRYTRISSYLTWIHSVMNKTIETKH